MTLFLRPDSVLMQLMHSLFTTKLKVCQINDSYTLPNIIVGSTLLETRFLFELHCHVICFNHFYFQHSFINFQPTLMFEDLILRTE